MLIIRYLNFIESDVGMKELGFVKPPKAASIPHRLILIEPYLDRLYLLKSTVGAFSVPGFEVKVALFPNPNKLAVMLVGNLLLKVL